MVCVVVCVVHARVAGVQGCAPDFQGGGRALSALTALFAAVRP